MRKFIIYIAVAVLSMVFTNLTAQQLTPHAFLPAKVTMKSATQPGISITQPLAKVLVVTGTPEKTNKSKPNFRVHPNPFIESVVISLKEIEQEITRITVANVIGATVLTKDISSEESKNRQLELNLSQLHPGIYFISINYASRNGTHQLTQKIIKN